MPSFHSVSAGVGGGISSKLLVTMDKPLSVVERIHRPSTDHAPVFPLSSPGKSRSLFEAKEVNVGIRMNCPFAVSGKKKKMKATLRIQFCTLEIIRENLVSAEGLVSSP